MRTSAKNLFLLRAVMAGLTLMLADQLTAQTFTTLHSFTGGKGGSQPMDGLSVSGDVLYGTTSMGGQADSSSNVTGTVFAINTDGGGFTNVHTFTALNLSNGTNSDGANPLARLLLSSNILYGTTWDGGDSGVGAVFRVNTDGTDFTNLHSFTATLGAEGGSGTNGDGAWCESVLAISGNTLYGTADFGGSAGNGTVFAVNTDGTGFTNLHSFTETIGGMSPSGFDGGTNGDGSEPYGGVVVSGNTLLGTTQYGGGAGNGTVFAIDTNGADFTNLYSFAALNLSNETNRDGTSPEAAPILSGGALYGIATSGGSSDAGAVFALSTDGTGITNLHSFTNGFGLYPYPGLALSGNTLYGTTTYGGSLGNGMVFALNTDGTGFTNLHSFTATLGGANFYGVSIGPNRDGSDPRGALVISGSTLYGTAENGGAYGNGTVYSISFAPRLTVVLSGTNVILTWPTNVAGFSYAGYTLQSTTGLNPPAAWTTVDPGPVIVGAQYAVTNGVSGAQQFYELSQ